MRFVQLDFQTVHTLCPAVDEVIFYDWYRAEDRRGQLSPLRILVLRAILFAAFPYLSEDELSKTPFSTVSGAESAIRTGQ